MAALEKILLASVVVLCGVLALQSIGIRPPARTFPLFVTGLTGALAAFALARSLVQSPAESTIGQARGQTILIGAAGLLAYAMLMSVSYLAATLMFLFLGYMYLMPKRSARGTVTAACVSLLTTGFTWLCFSYWLGVNLP